MWQSEVHLPTGQAGIAPSNIHLSFILVEHLLGTEERTEEEKREQITSGYIWVPGFLLYMEIWAILLLVSSAAL